MGKWENMKTVGLNCTQSRKNLAAEHLLLAAVCTEKVISESLAEFVSDIHDKILTLVTWKKHYFTSH